jgi:hypothetical protein
MLEFAHTFTPVDAGVQGDVHGLHVEHRAAEECHALAAPILTSDY